MKLFLFLGTASAFTSLFQPFYEQATTYTEMGVELVLNEIRDSESWGLTESNKDKTSRETLFNNLIADINEATQPELVDFILAYNDAEIQLHGLQAVDLTNSLDDIFAERTTEYTILTNADDFAALFFDETDEGYFTIAEEEDLMVAVTDFVAMINDMNMIFELDFDNWEDLLTKLVTHFLDFYVNVSNIFQFPMQTYIDILIEFAALSVGTYSEIMDSITEYNSLIGWTNICATTTPTTIFKLAEQVTSYLIFLTPRWVELANTYISFWNNIAENVPFFSNMNADLFLTEISQDIVTQIDDTLDNGKRTIGELELMASPFNALITEQVQNTLC